MNSSQAFVPGPEHVAPKENYEKPKVTTFGSVAELTMGSGGSVSDGSRSHHSSKTRR